MDTLALEIEVEEGSSVLLSLTLKEYKDSPGRYGLRVQRGGQMLFGGGAQVSSGGEGNSRNITLVDRVLPAGTYTYTVDVDPEGSPLSLQPGTTMSLVWFVDGAAP